MKTECLPVKRVLTLEAARAIADAALEEAVKKGFNQLVIIVVDDGGHLLFLQRQDDAEVAAIDIGIAKARTAAIFKRATKEWKERLLEGKYWVLGMPNMAPIEGGIPIVVEGRVIGAVGIAGAKGGADTEIGLASLAVLQNGNAQ
jgi:glc operon protein GlcG